LEKSKEWSMLTSNLMRLSEKLWTKLKRDFPERSISDMIVDTMIYLSRIAELNFRMAVAKRAQDTTLEGEIRDHAKKEIAKTILMLFVISKDLDVDVGETLNEGIFKYLLMRS